MPTVNSQNFTTLYSATAQEIVPAEPYGNANVEAFLNIGTDGGNTVQNILANGEIVANGNITTNDFFVGDGGYLSNITATTVNANFANYAGNVTNSAQPNITSVGTLVNLSVTGNIDSVSGIFNGDGSGLSNINVSNITGNANFANYAGNVTNSAQPNITSVGTLVTLNVSGNANVGGVNNAATKFSFVPEGRTIGVGAGGNISTLVVTDLGLNNSNANPGILTFIKGRGTVASPLPAANGDLTFRLNSGVITSTSNLATGANIPTAAQIQVTAPNAANASFSSTSWTPGQIRIRTGNPAGNIANANSSSNFNTLVFSQTGSFNMFQGAAGAAGFNFFGYSPAVFGFTLAGGNAEANAAIVSNQQLGVVNFSGATSTPAPGATPQVNTGAQIFANSAPNAVISAGQNFATDMFVSTRGGNLNLLANTATPDSSNQSINMATIGTGQVVINSNVTRLTGQMVFANNTQSPDILVSNNASNSTTRQLSLQAGNLDYTGVASNQTAGSLRLNSGNSDGSGSATTWIARGGSQILAAGYATSNVGNALGGAYNIFGGDATSLLTGNTVGGAFLMSGGAATANVGNATSANMEFLGGGAYTETGDSQGSNIVITSGSATSNTSGNAIAGSIYIDTQPATGVTSSTQGNINIGIGNATQINIGNTSNTALSFYPYTEAITGFISNVSLLTTGAYNGLNWSFNEATLIEGWDSSIDTAIIDHGWYGNDTVSGNVVYGGGMSTIMYGPVGSALSPSIFNVAVFEPGSDLSNVNTGTYTGFQVGQGGFTAVVGSQTNNPAIGAFIYGNTTQSQATAIRINRRRGNSDARTNVVANDYLGNIEWRGSGSATGSLNSKIVTFGAKVDSSYGGPGNVMPIGFEMDVVNSSNAFVTHSFYANGDVALGGSVSASNVSVNTNGFMKLASYTAAGLNAITGQIGWMAAVSDSAGGGNPNGMIAFWDTTNARWSYVHDNSAV